MKRPTRGKGMETPGGLVRLIVYLPPDLEAELRDVAYEQRRSKSDLIREAVREHLKKLR